MSEGRAREEGGRAEGGGREPVPSQEPRLATAGLPAPPLLSEVAFAPFLLQLPLGLPRSRPGSLPGRRRPARLNLLQEVGGEQPHLAAGVDLDVAASFISFLHHNLGLKD